MRIVLGVVRLTTPPGPATAPPAPAAAPPVPLFAFCTTRPPLGTTGAGARGPVVGAFPLSAAEGRVGPGRPALALEADAPADGEELPACTARAELKAGTAGRFGTEPLPEATGGV